MDCGVRLTCGIEVAGRIRIRDGVALKEVFPFRAGMTASDYIPA